MDYLEEIINILEANDIKSLPSQELINNNQRVALAVWKNFTIAGDYYGHYSMNEWYNEGKWGQVLKAYENNTQFWDKALAEKDFSSELILHSSFKEDFPAIAQSILTDNEKLLALFHKTSDLQIFQILTFDEPKKDAIYKDFVLSKHGYLNAGDIKKYQEDTQFVEAALKLVPSFYDYLTPENKLNDNYIKLVLDIDSTLFPYIPKEKQDQYFGVWLEQHKDQKHVLDNFTESQRDKILSVRPDLLSHALDRDPFKYKEMVIDTVVRDGLETFNHFSLNQLTNVFKQPKDLEKIKPLLSGFAINYSNVKEISKKENKIIAIISLDTDLRDQLRENIFYQLNEMTPGYKLPKEKFDGYVTKVIEKVENSTLTVEKANSFLGRLKNKMPSDVLKEEKLPNTDLYLHLVEKLANDKPKKLKM